MKPTYALPVVFLLAVACSDSATAPPTKFAGTGVASLRLGDPPPPPVATSVVLCVNGTCVVADGSYFSNGDVTTALTSTATTAAAQTDGVCSFPGPSWLRFKDASTTQVNGGVQTASAKGRIQCLQLTATGAGTITIAGVTYQLAPPFTFENTPECVEFCASFTAGVTVDGVPAGTATGEAFERSFFESEFCGVDESGVPYCNFGESGIG
jgi:hypothetical protein